MGYGQSSWGRLSPRSWVSGIEFRGKYEANNISHPTSHSIRAMGSMPPPSLPHSSRHSTVPPDWPNNLPETGSPQVDPQFQHDPTPAIRRFRSATPSSLSSLTVPVSAPANSSWGYAPPPMPPAYQNYGYWRTPADASYHAYAPQHMGPPVSASPVMGYESAGTPIGYGESSNNESYPTPAAE